ncbi:response regulator [Alsobacter sp. SYSU BS001988]
MPSTLHRLTVLVVDDFPPMLTIVTKQLAELGIRDVDCAANVGEALMRARARDYDLLIVDFFLGEQTGDDLLAALGEQGDEIPAIIMTGEAQKAATKLGHDVDWLRKPFTASDLQARILGALT